MKTNKETDENQVQDSTTVEQVDVNIDELFGAPGAESVMLPADGKPEEKPKSMFSKENTDITFLDKPVSKEEAKEI